MCKVLTYGACDTFHSVAGIYTVHGSENTHCLSLVKAVTLTSNICN